MSSYTLEQLKEAVAIKEQIAELETKLAKLFGETVSVPTAAESAAPVKKTRKMSAAGKARISAAAKARWAKARGEATNAPAPKKRGGISAAGRARISAAMKARWAARKKKS
jgi:hypothetical protein